MTMILMLFVFISGNNPMPMADEPLACLEKAIRARGNSEHKEKVVAKISGRSKGDATVRQFTRVTSLRHSLLHFEETWVENEKIKQSAIVFSGKKAWYRAEGETSECTADEYAVFKEIFYRAEVTLLDSLVDSKRFKLSSLPTIKIEDEDCIGLKVESEKQKDISLYFSKVTYLLRKVEAKRLGTDGKYYDYSEIRSDYKKFDGLMVATKTTTRVETDPPFVREEVIDKFEFATLKDVQGLFEKP